jgi:hypothetical protein
MRDETRAERGPRFSFVATVTRRANVASAGARGDDSRPEGLAERNAGELEGKGSFREGHPTRPSR